MALLCLAIGTGLLLARFSPNVLRECVRITRFGLALFGCCIFWILPQLAYTAIHTRLPAVTSFNRAPAQADPSSPRVIWILMDELSYDQVFDHRQPDLELPHFDQLRRDSVTFSNVQPEGYYTERILPALFLGRRIDNIRSSFERDLYVHDAKTSQWRPFRQDASVFGEAKRLGWTTGVAGWYNPYCQILQSVLDTCYWQSIISFPVGISGEKHGLADVMFQPLDGPLSHFKISASAEDLAVMGHAQEYKDISAAADSLIENASIRFLFIHLPVPHPPGIYNRETHTLGVKGTYLDNLVLADKTLGQLLGLIQRTTAASRTTFIISSDHSWRVDMWRVDPSWTLEEQRASKGRFDRRPVLMIHFPGCDSSELRSEPFPELGINGMLQAMLKDKLSSQTDMNRWLMQHERPTDQNPVMNP